MSINSRIKTALDSLTNGPAAADTYKGHEAEYIVFNYSMIPADFGDDDAGHYLALVQVHLYAPGGLFPPGLPVPPLLRPPTSGDSITFSSARARRQ